MEQIDIINKLNNIFREVMDNEDIVITPESSANDIEEWDSLTHVQLIIAIEKSFNIRFKSSEIRNWKNVGEMIEAIQNKF
ncbi:MAG: acyl carrier protein [Bacteroidetes bacterium GWE2_29_8]|nr:MAG: acyl carrier protein [Bacteroidetes bacterium GWE2_29_8]OFY24582.1 MAG: acyl carrier protein [Bacteroidetes bacterium GWF2_29_10]